MWLLGAGAALAVLVAGSAPADRVHVVQPGETLWQIAAAVTGDARDWPLLYRANRDQIKDPARLYPGQRLNIPEADPAADETPPAAPPAGRESGAEPRD